MSHIIKSVGVSREQFGGLILVVVVASFSLLLALHPRLLFPEFAIKGVLTGPLTVWTGHIKIESDVIVDGNNTLIIDGAVIQNSAAHVVFVRDSANLTIKNGSKPLSALDVVDDEFRVTCEDNSVVRVSNSTVGLMFTYNNRGSVLIESSSIIGRLATMSDLGGVKPTIRNSTVHELHPQVHISGNFSLRGSRWSGDVEIMVDVENTSIVEWTRYHLAITDARHGVIHDPTIKLEKVWIHDSHVTVTEANYTTVPIEYQQARVAAFSLYVVDSTILIEASNLGWHVGGDGRLVLEGSSRANITRSVIGNIEAYDESQLFATYLNVAQCKFYEQSHGTIRDSIDHGWVWQTGREGEVFDVRWNGIYESVDAYGNATILLDNVIVNRVYYDNETIGTRGG
jgi:hypothetical protein